MSKLLKSRALGAVSTLADREDGANPARPGQHVKVSVLGQQSPLRATPCPYGVIVQIRDPTSLRLLTSFCWKNHCSKYEYQ